MTPLTYLKIGGAAALAILLGLFYWHYEYISGQAALVPGLQSTIAADDRIANDLVQIQNKLDLSNKKYDAELTNWQGIKDDIISKARLALAHTPAAINPVCSPSAADRSVFNDALRTLSGSQGPAGQDVVPAGPGTPH